MEDSLLPTVLHTPRAIDLFAGAGGASLGLIAAGWDVVAAVEWDRDAAATYRANVGDHVIEADITALSPDDLPDADYWHASPPCQGFSFAGKRDPNDPRNGLWRDVLRLVDAKRPAFVSIENVRGMLSMGADKPLMLAFEALGYSMTRYLLNAADYGVPQTRKRVIFVGNRLGLPNPCPTPTHAQPPRHIMLGLQPWVTVRQALGIGGVLMNQYGKQQDGTIISAADTPFFDGDAVPARSLRASGGVYSLGVAADRMVHHRSGRRGQRRHHVEIVDDFAARLDAPAASGSQPGRHGSLKRPDKEPGSFILDRPSPVISAGGTATGGAEPLVRERLRQEMSAALLDEPSRALRAGAHGQPGYSPRHVAGYVPTERTDHGLIDLDEPACTIKAGGNREADGHQGGPCPPSIAIRGRLSGDGDGAMLDDAAPTVAASFAMDVVDLNGDRRAYVDNEGRTHHRPAHSARLRRLTVRECAILQDFPPDFVFCGSQTEQHRQVGNAYPRGLARAVAGAIRETMRR